MAGSDFTVQDFGGLDLVNDPPEVKGATQMDNIDLDTRGRIRVRDGSNVLGGTASSTTGVSMLMPVVFGGTESLLQAAVSATQVVLDKITTSGTRTNIGAWTATAVGPGARIGTPTAEAIYIPSTATTTTGALLRKWDGTTLSTFASKPICVGVLPTSNRLAHAGFFAAEDTPFGADGSRSTIFFSGAGTPETFAANDFVPLLPGDGDVIIALVTWRDMLFVFKRNTLFVFTGTTDAGAGNVLFNYRTISLPDPLFSAIPTLNKPQDGYATAGEDGVYFATTAGIYRTDGGVPQYVSEPVRPMFVVRSTAGVPGPVAGRARVSWIQHRLYVRYQGFSLNDQWLVWDEQINAWMAWSLPFNIGEGSPVLSNGKITYPFKGNAFQFVVGFTTDPDASGGLTTDITAQYRSGFSDYGTPHAKLMREIGVWGSGSPTLSVFSDQITTDMQAAVVAIPGSSLEARQRLARRGRQFAWQMSSTSGTWQISSLDFYLRPARAPELRV